MDEQTKLLIAKIDELRGAVMSTVHLNRMLLWNQSVSDAGQILNSSRSADPLRLLRHGFKVFSQNDEDGIIAEIFKRIGTRSRTFLEFGVEGGLECNSLFLLHQGWSGGWIEGSSKHVASIASSHASMIAAKKLKIINTFVDAENINALIEENGLADVDLLSIDIDGNDYWVWKAVTAASPRVLVIEYNAIMPADIEWIVEYDTKRVYDGSVYHSASLKSLELLGRKKGYALVGCNLNGCNAFFVRNDLLEKDGRDLFCAPYTSENHFEPFRHPYLKILAGKKATAKMPVQDM